MSVDMRLTSYVEYGREVKLIIFDAVLDADYLPIYNDTRANTIAWLKAHPEINRPIYSVNPGDLMKFISVGEYLERYDV